MSSQNGTASAGSIKTGRLSREEKQLMDSILSINSKDSLKLVADLALKRYDAEISLLNATIQQNIFYALLATALFGLVSFLKLSIEGQLVDVVLLISFAVILVVISWSIIEITKAKRGVLETEVLIKEVFAAVGARMERLESKK